MGFICELCNFDSRFKIDMYTEPEQLSWPKTKMKSIIFLDIDGVLNGHVPTENGYNTVEKSNAAALNYILDNTDSNVVISSAWRYLIHSGSMTLRGFENLLISHGIKCSNRVIGLTRRDKDQCECSLKDRVDAILEWVTDNNVKKYMIIDDLHLPILENFYRTNGNIGLTMEDAINIKFILEN
jgi:hypothetical protein